MAEWQERQERQERRVTVAAEVAEALRAGRGVVALESTLIAHGLPRPENLALAREVEALVRAAGAVPATIGVVQGQAVVGLNGAQLARLATRDDVAKLSVRDLPVALAKRIDGATTVASTALLAARAGIRVFATGGLGGVHRDARESWDESADLVALARSPICVVCAGVKSILDVGATLERLESLSVTVAGYRTDRFPGFYLADTGYPLDWRVETPDEVAGILVARDDLRVMRVASEESGPGGQFQIGAVVVANPLPLDAQLDPALHDRVLRDGLAEVARRGIRGKAVTPFLLAHFRSATGGESLRVNMEIIRRNARLAAEIAVALSHASPPPGAPAR